WAIRDAVEGEAPDQDVRPAAGPLGHDRVGAVALASLERDDDLIAPVGDAVEARHDPFGLILEPNERRQSWETVEMPVVPDRPGVQPLAVLVVHRTFSSCAGGTHVNALPGEQLSRETRAPRSGSTSVAKRSTHSITTSPS